jgi:hypothetical protein
MRLTIEFTEIEPMRRITALPIIAVYLTLGLAATATAQPAATNLDKLWADLASADEATSTRAILALAAAPKDSIPFLRDRLKPVKVDADRVAKLVKQMESPKFAEREAASRELAADVEYLGRFAKPALEKYQGEGTSAEARRRVRELIDRIPPDSAAAPGEPPRLTGKSVGVKNANGQITIIIDGKMLDLNSVVPKPLPCPPAGWVRAARAAAILEHLGTTDARRVLESLATGEPDAPPTKAAKAALERMKP